MVAFECSGGHLADVVADVKRRKMKDMKHGAFPNCNYQCVSLFLRLQS